MNKKGMGMNQIIKEKRMKLIQELINGGYKKGEVAKIMNVSLPTVNKYLRGDRYGKKESFEEKYKKRKLPTRLQYYYPIICRYFDIGYSAERVLELKGIPETREIYLEYMKNKKRPSP